jgi:hypothetical protein
LEFVVFGFFTKQFSLSKGKENTVFESALLLSRGGLGVISSVRVGAVSVQCTAILFFKAHYNKPQNRMFLQPFGFFSMQKHVLLTFFQ